MSKETMKTNQFMNVRINDDLVIQIYHKSKLGKVDNVLAYGNFLREQRGLPIIEMKEILRKSEFWEFVIARNTQSYKEMLKSQTSKIEVWNNTTNSDKSQSGNLPLWNNTRIDSDYSILQQYKDKFGRIKYNELIKEFPHLIKSQRGGKVENRGYWLDLYLLLKVGAMLDKDLEVQIYNTFIKGKILEHRDEGGVAFKNFNKVADMCLLSNESEDFKKSYYRHISVIVRQKLDITKNWGYNESDHIALKQKLRVKIYETASSLIKMGMLTDYQSVRTFIINFPL